MNEQEVFLEALALDGPDKRDAYLDVACAGNPALRAAVEALLQANLGASKFLDHPPDFEAATIDPPELEGVGTTLGPYKLLDQLGEGGFGVVYLAEQTQPVRRKVALKILKPGMNTRQVVARFEAERQALAIMDHPNIARVFDGGATFSGRPYFVMELVKGAPITDYCDQNHLSPSQRLELFMSVCHAVQHAHQKGIIHRDLKPSNVLVSRHDTTAVVKVIDFGIAKALGQELTDKTLFTGVAQMIGTPLYMSPEQAGLSDLDVDTRSDIYSLGVLLYELLTGSTPFPKERFRQAAFDEIRRIIREEEPPRPSTRLSDSKDSLPSISALRQTEPTKLTSLIRGELDWIVMKALEKDRNRRYETASSLAQDVQRFLADEPVHACPPSASYRVRKFLRRNHRAISTAALVGACLILFGGGLAYVVHDRSQRREVLKAEVLGALDKAKSAYAADDMSKALAAAEHAKRLAASELLPEDLRRQAVDWWTDLAAVKSLDDVLLQVVTSERERIVAKNAEYERIFRDLGIDIDALSVEQATQLIHVHPIASKLVEALDHWTEIRSRMVALRVDGATDESHWRQLALIVRAADPDHFRTRVRLAIEQNDWPELDRLAQSADVATLPPLTLLRLASTLFDGGQDRQHQALALAKNAQRQRPDSFHVNASCADFHKSINPPRLADMVYYLSAAQAILPRNARLKRYLGMVYQRMGLHDDAIAVLRQSMQFEPGHGDALFLLGINLREAGRLDESFQAFQEALKVPGNRAAIYTNLGINLARQQRDREAIAAFRQAVELAPDDVDAHWNLGRMVNLVGDSDEALVVLEQTVQLTARYPEDNKLLAKAWQELGTVLARRERFDEALAAHRRALQLDPQAATAWNHIGALLCDRKQDYDGAIEAFRNAIAIENRYPDAHENLGLALYHKGHLPQAIESWRTAVELNPQDAEIRQKLSSLLMYQASRYYRSGLLGEGVSAYCEAIAVAPSQNAEAFNRVAWVLSTCPEAKWRDPEKAVDLARRAIEGAASPNGQSACYGTLGLALLRNGDYAGAIAAQRKAIELANGGDCCDFLVLAMAEQKLGHEHEARQWFDRARASRDGFQGSKLADDIDRLLAEAQELLGIAAHQG